MTRLVAPAEQDPIQRAARHQATSLQSRYGAPIRQTASVAMTEIGADIVVVEHTEEVHADAMRDVVVVCHGPHDPLTDGKNGAPRSRGHGTQNPSLRAFEDRWRRRRGPDLRGLGRPTQTVVVRERQGITRIPSEPFQRAQSRRDRQALLVDLPHQSPTNVIVVVGAAGAAEALAHLSLETNDLIAGHCFERGK